MNNHCVNVGSTRRAAWSLAAGMLVLLSGLAPVRAELPPAVVSLFSLGAGQGWALDGPEFTARAGAALNGDCDFNGDGYVDLLIGALGAGPNDQGTAFVVFGSSAGATPPPSLNNAGLRLLGEQSGDEAGASVACAGDVDADGFDDMLIGAPFADSFGASSGTAYLVYGGESLPFSIGLGTLTASTGMRINGVVAGQRLGGTVAGGGDVNGDGYADVLLTGPNFSATSSNPGQAYVIFGSASLPASFALATLNGSNGFAVNSTSASTLSLGVAAVLGDINGDNYPDVVLGAPLASPGAVASAGSVFVVFGHGGGFPALIGLNTLNGSTGFEIDGVVGGGKLGGSLGFVSISDFNGDGRADLVLGAPGAANGTSSTGHAYLLFGAPIFPAVLSLASLNGSNGLALTSAATGDVLGNRVAGLFDVNGDGLGEVILGAPGADFGVTDAGGAYVVYGRRSGLPADFLLSALNGSNGFRIQGAVGFDAAGQTVCRAGDLNRDGFADLVVGVPEADPNATQAEGRVYAIFGNDLIYRDGFN
ncbi:MAG: integrin alpha [Tahibacter sp.]